MLIEDIIALVLADNTVTGLIASRFYSGPVLPRGYTLPAALLHAVTDATDYTFSGSSPLNEANVQLDVYGDTEAAVKSIQSAIRAVLENYKGTTGSTKVDATLWKSDGDMPFSADINKAGIGYRVMSRLCFYYEAV